MEEASKFEAYYVAEVGRRCNEVVEFTKQLYEQVASAAAGLKELLAVHAKLESHKANADSLDEALKVSQKVAATIRGVV